MPLPPRSASLEFGPYLDETKLPADVVSAPPPNFAGTAAENNNLIFNPRLPEELLPAEALPPPGSEPPLPIVDVSPPARRMSRPAGLARAVQKAGRISDQVLGAIEEGSEINDIIDPLREGFEVFKTARALGKMLEKGWLTQKEVDSITGRNSPLKFEFNHVSKEYYEGAAALGEGQRKGDPDCASPRQEPRERAPECAGCALSTRWLARSLCTGAHGRHRIVANKKGGPRRPPFLIRHNL